MVFIRALRPEDDRSRFSSGNDDLDRFFHRFAAFNQFVEHIGVTYIVVEDREAILGFVTLAGAEIRAASFAATRKRKLPRYSLPALRLARLAVSVDSRKRGIGSLLVRYTLALALEKEAKTGCIGVLVDAKPEAVEVYGKLGFEREELIEGMAVGHPAPIPMFLHIETIRAAIQ